MDEFIEMVAPRVIECSNMSYVASLFEQIHKQCIIRRMDKLGIKRYTDKNGFLWYVTNNGVLHRISKESQGRLKTNKTKE